jgi:hypothetical protein
MVDDRTRFERREPRCRICRKEAVRVVVNDLLAWRGVPISTGAGPRHRLTYADIHRELAVLYQESDEGDQISYASLWVHAKRHYDLAGVAEYQRGQMVKQLRYALTGTPTRPSSSKYH